MTEDPRVAKARGYAQTASWLTGADIVEDLLDAYDECLRVNVGLVMSPARRAVPDHLRQPESLLSPDEAARLFPRGVGDPFCPRGGVIKTLTDHRLLWHLESVLGVDAPMGTRLDEVRRDLRKYLNVRCEHHWHHHPPEGDLEEMWQCLWCCDTLMQSDAPTGGEVCQPDGALEYWPTASAQVEL